MNKKWLVIVSILGLVILGAVSTFVYKEKRVNAKEFVQEFIDFTGNTTTQDISVINPKNTEGDTSTDIITGDTDSKKDLIESELSKYMEFISNPLEVEPVFLTADFECIINEGNICGNVIVNAFLRLCELYDLDYTEYRRVPVTNEKMVGYTWYESFESERYLIDFTYFEDKETVCVNIIAGCDVKLWDIAVHNLDSKGISTKVTKEIVKAVAGVEQQIIVANGLAEICEMYNISGNDIKLRTIEQSKMQNGLVTLCELEVEGLCLQIEIWHEQLFVRSRYI